MGSIFSTLSPLEEDKIVAFAPGISLIFQIKSFDSTKNVISYSLLKTENLGINNNNNNNNNKGDGGDFDVSEGKPPVFKMRKKEGGSMLGTGVNSDQFRSLIRLTHIRPLFHNSKMVIKRMNKLNK